MSTYHSPSPHAATIAFLIALRYRLLLYASIVGTVLIAFLFLPKPLYAILSYPLSFHWPSDTIWKTMNKITYLTLSFKLALIASLFVTVPVLLYQIWSFIFPHLFKQYYNTGWLLLFLSILLFYIGVSITYFTVFPVLLDSFKQSVLQALPPVLAISYYLGFAFKLFFIFGLSFANLILMVFLVLSGLVRLQRLHLLRRYIVGLAFFVGFFILSIDIKSQLFFVLPLWALFEIGLIAAYLFYGVQEQKIK